MTNTSSPPNGSTTKTSGTTDPDPTATSNWRDHAACIGQLDTFSLNLSRHNYLRNERQQQRAAHALAICHSCPSLQPCRTETLQHGYEGYIAGGLLPWEQGPTPSQTNIA